MSIAAADRPRFLLWVLIALVVLAPLGGTALYVAVFSMADCPQSVHQEKSGWAWGKYRCFRCKDSSRITILDRWRHGKESSQHWEGMEVSKISTAGFVKTNAQTALSKAGLSTGIRMTQRLRMEAYRSFLETENYQRVTLDVRFEGATPGKVELRVVVDER